MSITEIDILMKRLNISKDKIQYVGETLIKHNLNGLALYSCNLEELRDVLNLPLGDWTLFQSIILFLKKTSVVLVLIHLYPKKKIKIIFYFFFTKLVKGNNDERIKIKKRFKIFNFLKKFYQNIYFIFIIFTFYEQLSLIYKSVQNWEEKMAEDFPLI
ncbi:hypothetical protein Mgra_00009714 [Meloidogyne graminicola]|uniref:Kinase D-interacting substrate of 220 kDa-like SAM domain-containing protein n=1 Tax=Meloidogyne graminicola TaxID=189291 RepID=A0A8S9Z8P4_9BILA|nr:hypothetical protein Mgra_00009714 [Meloidogyne graminicola]